MNSGSDFYDGSGIHANPFASQSSDEQPFYNGDQAVVDPQNDAETDQQDEGEHEAASEPDTEEPQQAQLSEEAPPSDAPHDEIPSETPTDASVAPSDAPAVPASKPKRTIKKYKLSLKVTALERQGKKDPIIKFDAYTTLPRFRTTTFRDIRRTHQEFVKFFEHLNGANPECFVPAVPPAVTSAGAGTEEDERRVKANIQTWLDRVSSNPILARDEEFVYFIEADFGYTPVVKGQPPASGLTRKAMKQLQPPYDEIVELHELRPLIKRVYQLGLEANVKLDKVTKNRRSLGLAMNDFGTKVMGMANLETNGNVVNMWRKLAKAVTNVGDYESVRATSEAVSFGDTIAVVSTNAYVAKEALTNRHLLMRELTKAQTTTRSRHQVMARVKGSTNINPLKVDEAIAAVEEATRQEEQLTNKVRRVSENMLFEKKVLLGNMEHDITTSIADYTLRIIDCERRTLSTWESIRIDVRAADANGGLSRLGREATPANRRATTAQSQSLRGDSWSGDRQARASEFRSRLSADLDDDPQEVPADEETIVDARNAASLLAGSTF